jgi:agmatinase
MQKIPPLPISNSSMKEARFVVLGVPSDKGSTYRKGAAKAPETIRRMIARNEIGSVMRNGKKSLFDPELQKFIAKVHDYGDISLDKTEKTIRDVVKAGKFPVVIGGDHSITYKTLSGIAPKKKFSLIYLDAHPDFICSSRNYFGSVMCDISKLKSVDIKSSIIVGVRTPEDEEIDNIKESGVRIVTATDIIEHGIKDIVKLINRTVSENAYLSIDMDVVDPAFAPGVTEPEPGGISSNELIYLVNGIAKKVNIGFDIMEVCPPYDIQGMTSYLAYRVMLEAISAINRN